MKGGVHSIRFAAGRRLVAAALSLMTGVVLSTLSPGIAQAQQPSVLYTWPGTDDVREWIRAFGTNTVTLSNSVAGEFTITETGAPGSSVAFSDGFNRIREAPLGSGGGLDLTGLDFLQFDMGHTGSGPINVQFYSQTTPASTYVALGPDVAIAPGIATYQVPLSVLSADQQLYVRTIGISARDHAAVGNVTWTLREVRSAGSPLTVRDLITHDTGTAEGGLQGAIVNFDGAAVQGNTGQDQTGLAHNPAGSGSLRWVDLGGSNGAAISWGNGAAWNGDTFNNRTTDLSGYTQMIVRMSATGATAAGDTLGLAGFLQRNNFQYQQTAGLLLPIDGQYHDLKFSINGITNLNVVDQTGINLFGHPNDLTINVDNIRFRNVQFVEHRLFSWESSLEGWMQGPEVGHVHSIVTTGHTHGSTALQIDRSSVRGNGTTDDDDEFVSGSIFTTTNAAVISDMVPRINNAFSVAFDVTYEDQLPANPSGTNFYVAFDDHNGGFYQAATANFNINGAPPNTMRTLEIPIANFVDPDDGTKTLSLDQLLESTNEFSIRIISNTDYGAVYQIDNFRLITEVAPLTADFNGDMVVNGTDLGIWKTAFATSTAGNADGDADTDGNDFLIWQREAGSPASMGGVAAVPEPAAWTMVVCASAAAMRRRRH